MKMKQKSRVSVHKESEAFRAAYDFPLITMTNRLLGIKKDFKKVAFIGPNPYFFLQHMPGVGLVEKFYFCEQAEASV